MYSQTVISSPTFTDKLMNQTSDDSYQQQSSISLLAENIRAGTELQATVSGVWQLAWSIIRLDIPSGRARQEAPQIYSSAKVLLRRDMGEGLLLDLAAAIPPKDDVLVNAFNAIALQEGVGETLLNEAKGILASASYPVKKIEPLLTNDQEEDHLLLLIRLYVDAEFEKAMELDSLLTKRMVATFHTLPEQLSFAVYEQDD